MNNNHGGNIYEAAKKYSLKKDEIIDFSSNINPLGISNKALKGLRDNLKHIERYPDSNSTGLREAIGRYHSINPENILVGNGVTALIHHIPRVLRPKRVLMPVPTFSEYESACRASGTKIKYIRLEDADGFRIDEEKLIRCLDNTDLLFLCNPNNPTGQLLPRKGVLKIADKAEKKGVIVVLDEVFIDYAERESLIKEAVRKKNLIVLRAFTKFFAMPGLRLGYIAANSKIINMLKGEMGTWPVNSLAQIAGEITLNDRDYILMPFPSSTNFILIRIKSNGLDAPKLYNILAKRGILIRDCTNFGVGNKFFRVAVKKRRENIRLLTEMRGIF
ncbi:MAG: aminotransferase class I/II-fold pyridoxal phosphate-dependent enzyme [Nitrospirae bacterium]|nr:aminotransferase class I/II-fold pyridoxal phosphate-dependent enzyme [Nitrospirota bacterium]